MSIVSCNSCGMQYNAAGYQPGVQFQCTQCGAMVVVAARGGRPGRPATGNLARVTGRGPAGSQGAPRSPYGAPQRKGNAGLFIGIGVGVAVVALIVIVIVAASGPAPKDQAQEEAKRAFDEQNKAIAAKNEETKVRNARIKTTIDAAMAKGPELESALISGNRAAIDALYDWNAYADYNSRLVARDPKYLNSPLFSTGEWGRDDTGRVTSKWVPKELHNASTLKTAVLDFIEKAYFGSPKIEWDRRRTEVADGGFSGIDIFGKPFMGKRILVSVRGAGTALKEFWVGAPEGDANVRFMNFLDKDATERMAQDAIAAWRKANPEVVDDDRGLMGGHREREGSRVGERPAEGEGEGPAPAEEIALPPLAKTNAMPTDAALINVVNSIKAGNKLMDAQKRTITSANSAQKKATLGAFIDALVDAHKAGSRREKATISAALLEVWGNFARRYAWLDSEVTYDPDGSVQSTSDDPIRRWIHVFNEYS